MNQSLPISIPPASKKGFTIVEVLVATAIISIVGVGILTSIGSYLRLAQLSQDKVIARNIANGKIEELRNMPYDDVATVNGPIFPPGNLLDEEQVTVGGRVFYIQTLINFVDDPFDGNALGTIPLKPQDFYPYDFKKITINVRDFNNNKILAESSTNLAGKAAETSSNTGILSLTVLDSLGVPVALADVRLTNPSTAPAVDITTFTDINGKLQIPLLPPDASNGYHLVVSKTGFSGDQTYPDNIVNYDPVIPDFNIIAQQVTEITLSIDLLSNLAISVKDESGSAEVGLAITARGDKLTHRHEFDPDDPGIPKYVQTLTTDSSGNIAINNIEWDSYAITVPVGYFVVTTSPYQNVSLGAGITLSVEVVVTTDSAYPTIVTVNPSVEQTGSSFTMVIDGTNLVSGSSIKLTKNGESDINATGESSVGDIQLSGNFDLTGVATGVWNIVVTDPGGKVATQKSGFTIDP